MKNDQGREEKTQKKSSRKIRSENLKRFLAVGSLCLGSAIFKNIISVDRSNFKAQR